MSYLIDTHCHLHDPEFFSASQQKDFLRESFEAGVEQMICIGTSLPDSKNALDFASRNKNVFWTFGLHPELANPNREDSAPKSSPASLLDLIQSAQTFCKSDLKTSTKLVAIGEVGLDYHYPNTDKKSQWQLLEAMLDLAQKLELPCSFHVRDALDDFFSIISNFPRLKPSVLHSFTDSKENLEKALNLGFYIGLNGIATFANLSCFREISPALLSRFVLETDAPFLTPAPKRGIINRPSMVKLIASWLSSRTELSPSKIAELTTENAKQVFDLPYPEPIS